MSTAAAGEESTAERRVRFAVLATAIVVASAFGTSVVLTGPVSFDGALNAQAAMNLVEHGRYGLGGAEFRDFDHRLQTGPTVVLPTALVFRLLGVGNSVAQLPNLVYFVLFFAVATHFAFRHGGVAGAVIALGLLVQTPRIGPLGLRLYGEIPALFFFLVGLLLLDHIHKRAQSIWAAVAGLFFGLAISTKIVMVIPVAATGLVVLAISITRRSFNLRHLAALAGGTCAPVAIFEVIKILVLGPTVWVGWWAVMVRRTAGQGLPIGMPDTPGALPKTATHLAILSQSVGVPLWCLVLLLLVPTILLALLWRRARAADSPVVTISVSVVSLWLAATSFVGWWLVLTPTSRAWPRRVLIGLLLQELLISVVLGLAFQSIARHHRRSNGRGTRRLVQGAGFLAVVLFFAVGSLLAYNFPRIDWPSAESLQRREIEAVARTMRTLASSSLIYGVGWYRAPVLALLSGREIKDFNWFPVERYGKSLTNTYFVVDNHLASHQPQLVEEILARSVYQTVIQAGNCALYELKMVLPYPPIPIVDRTDHLRNLIHPKDDDYPYEAGLGGDAPGGRFADAVAAFVLERDHRGCLLVDLWPSTTISGRPTLEVRVDHERVRWARLVAGRPWKQEIALQDDVEPETPGSLVELWVFGDLQETPFSLWGGYKDRFVVREVGFVPCPDPDD
jgi:hypothetical protein